MNQINHDRVRSVLTDDVANIDIYGRTNDAQEEGRFRLETCDELQVQYEKAKVTNLSTLVDIYYLMAKSLGTLALEEYIKRRICFSCSV